MPIASMPVSAFLSSLLAVGLAIGAQPADQPPAKPPVAFPHPLVTEVLFSVPRGDEGDANADAKRSPTGDEFVELVNPHDQPINLKGYRLVDGTTVGGKVGREATREPSRPSGREPQPKDDEQPEATTDSADASDDAHFTFTFPDLTLQPGEVVVVFNGFESAIPGNVGTAAKAAPKHERFGGAYVFTAGITSQYAAFSNQHDVLQVLSPSGEPVETIRWDYRDEQRSRTAGSSDSATERTAKDTNRNRPRPNTGGRNSPPARVLDKRAEESAGKVENLPPVRSGSVQRESITGDFRPHAEVSGTLLSPGVFGPQAKLDSK